MSSISFTLIFIFIINLVAGGIARFTLITDSQFPITLQNGIMHVSQPSHQPQEFSLMDDGTLWSLSPVRQIVDSVTVRLIQVDDSDDTAVFSFGVENGYLTCFGSNAFYIGTSANFGMGNSITTVEFGFATPTKLKVVIIDDFLQKRAANVGKVLKEIHSTQIFTNSTVSISKTITSTAPPMLTTPSQAPKPTLTKTVTPFFPMTNTTLTVTTKTGNNATIIPPNNRTNETTVITTTGGGLGNSLSVPVILLVICGALI